jgi:hypothetical protein
MVSFAFAASCCLSAAAALDLRVEKKPEVCVVADVGVSEVFVVEAREIDLRRLAAAELDGEREIESRATSRSIDPDERREACERERRSEGARRSLVVELDGCPPTSCTSVDLPRIELSSPLTSTSPSFEADVVADSHVRRLTAVLLGGDVLGAILTVASSPPVSGGAE